jgi:hypothetical protein
MATWESGRFPRGLGKTKSQVRNLDKFSRMTMARPESGTLCSLPAFMRGAGMVQIFSCQSISGRCSPFFLADLDRIAPGPEDLTVFVAVCTRLSEPDARLHRAKPHLRAGAAPGEPIHPSPGEGLRNAEVKAATV